MSEASALTSSYRIVLNKDQITDPELRKMVVDEPACRLWIGPHAHVVAYSLKAGRCVRT